MAEVVDIFTRKPVEQRPTFDTVIEETIHILQHDWQHMAKTNSLNEYFIRQMEIWTIPETPYMMSLDAIAEIEKKLNYSIVIQGPVAHHMGWRVSFVLAGGTVSTPSMAFETYARCFAALLFIKLKHRLIALDMTEYI